MTDEGQLDAILVECAQRDMESSYVIGLLYKKEGDQLQFAETALRYRSTLSILGGRISGLMSALKGE